MEMGTIKKLFSDIFTEDDITPFHLDDKSNIDNSIIDLIDELILEGIEEKYLFVARKNYPNVIYINGYRIFSFPPIVLPGMISKAKIDKFIETLDNKISEGDYQNYLFTVELANPSLLKFALEAVYSQIPDEKVFEVMEEFYTNVDYIAPFITAEMWKRMIDNQPVGKKEEFYKELCNYFGYETLPEKITIYRGVGSESTPLTATYSWTVSGKEVLKFFLHSPDASWYEATVYSKDIIHFYNGRGEAEVWISPDSVHDIKENKQYDTVFVQDALSHRNLSELFSFIRTNIIDSSANIPTHLGIERMNSTNMYHSNKHLTNVMFSSTLLSHALELDTQEILISLLAAAVHDFNRRTDFDAPNHGYESAKNWVEALCIGVSYDDGLYPEEWAEVADELSSWFDLGFQTSSLAKEYQLTGMDAHLLFTIVRIHDLDDYEAYSFIEKELDSSEHQRAIKLLNILKDADAIDRLRISDLDVSFLRLDESKKIIKPFFDFQENITVY